MRKAPFAGRVAAIAVAALRWPPSVPEMAYRILLTVQVKAIMVSNSIVRESVNK
jgi:hypothetical protein